MGGGRLPARHPVAGQGTMTEDSRGTWIKEEKESLSLPLFLVSLFTLTLEKLCEGKVAG